MKNINHLLTILAFFFLFSAVACNTYAPKPTATAAATLQPGDTERKLTVDGLERSYLLHIPPGLTVWYPAALVFVFHGMGENASLVQQTSGFNEIADKGSFIVVYPNGSGSSSALSWNANGCGCEGYALKNNIDDKAFVRQIIADVATIGKIDPKRTYAAGFSNGAALSYRLACEMSDTFAAVAPVAGYLATVPCQPTQPVSIIDFHGMTDNAVLFAGGGIDPATGQPMPPVEQSLATWANLDECSNTPKTEQSGLLTHTAYSSCKNRQLSGAICRPGDRP